MRLSIQKEFMGSKVSPSLGLWNDFIQKSLAAEIFSGKGVN
jgi:hypothetical protein